MISIIKDSFNVYKKDKRLKEKVIWIYSFLIFINLGFWLAAYFIMFNHPKLFALCLLAYGFGLRHAVDADHIATIDNVTRKFMQEGKKPVGIGFFFSLGHSTVVVLMSIAVALGAIYLKDHLSQFANLGKIIGTSVSSIFLLIIAIINLIIFIDILRILKTRSLCSDNNKENSSEDIFANNGLLVRIFRPLFRFVNKSWHMYLIGFLFGLGFDTATEIALLGISGTQAAQGVSIWVIMLFPLLFMAGMCLVDTTDGVLMLGVYGWAFVKPFRKLFYNMMITLISFMLAFFIGGIEALSIISNEMNLSNGIWYYVNHLSAHMGNLGYYIIGVFILSWIISALIYKLTNAGKGELQNSV